MPTPTPPPDTRNPDTADRLLVREFFASLEPSERERLLVFFKHIWSPPPRPYLSPLPPPLPSEIADRIIKAARIRRDLGPK